jgi:hypothetical protein
MGGDTLEKITNTTHASITINTKLATSEISISDRTLVITSVLSEDTASRMSAAVF